MKSKTLENIFYDVKNPAVYGTANKLKNSLKPRDKKFFPKKKIKEWLLHQPVVTLHHPATHNFKRNHYKIFGIDELWEIDLCDMTSFAKYNDGYKFILSVIDVFSKYGWMVPIKSKNATETTRAFRKLINDSGRSPRAVQSDYGREFKNSMFAQYLQRQDIKQHFPQIQSMHKAAVVERFNRTMKEKMFHYFSAQGKSYKRYIDVLQHLVDSYNNSVHSTIKMRPIDVKSKHIAKIYKNITQNHKNEKDTYPVLQEGDYVRIIRKKAPLEHGYTEKWTREVFKVDQVIFKKPYPLYRLVDLKGSNIHGKFYAQQLQKIKIYPDSPIKIIKTRGIGKNLQYLVETANRKQVWLSKVAYEKIKL